MLCLAFSKKLNVAQRVHGDDSADGTDTVGGIAYFFVGIQDEIGRVDDLSALFPKAEAEAKK